MSVVTFLFTDIEGSTRRWEADADAMPTALDAHNTLLRNTVGSPDGHVFNYTGDGMCAVFTSPRSAVDAAVAAQRALELPVRMGIATGEAERRGDDYFGTVLNRTARVMAARGQHRGHALDDRDRTREPDDAFNYLTVAIRYLHDAGRFFYLPVPLAVLVVLLDRLGRYEPASTISGFAATSYTRSSLPKVAQVVTHLREVLGDEAYQSLAAKGQRMTAPAIVAYALEQIDQARQDH